ncbi:hypothetical protein GWI33_015941 [Rhynchophorus ferrugineus]|uniref:Uncharacterized protein n=1 Tax=Rhynchophorus ferrugineus TaxID=354439 RepID=A0A834I4G0_RHYFE|nr:hypothetical protein GWI33_015941 [Rhynchophorus ferrugineus]
MEEMKKRTNDLKREIPVVPSTTRFAKIRIKLNEEIITPKDQMRYLGVILDGKNIYINHLKAIKEKVETVVAKMAEPIRRKYGNMARDIMKNIYERVLKPAIQYGYETWRGHVNKVHTQMKLNATQRYALILITGTYKTTPTGALQVTAGIVPLPIETET